MNRNKQTIKTNGKKYSNKSSKGSKGKGFNPKKEEQFFEQKTVNHATDYFSDQQLAEQNSYVSNRNIADASQTIYDTDVWYPTVIAHAYNPCPSSTTYSISNGVVTPNALSISATKLLTAIIANTGRVKNYTRTDISFLILAIGQFIAMHEFGRRTFGLNFKFADLNRDIPDQFIEACGFDPEDFRQNRPSYLSQFNYWTDLSNQIVIPMEKIPYFRRCRDMYRDVYRDLAAGQTVYHINVPYSTWILDEDATPGTRLRTINVTGPHEYMAYETTPMSSTVPTAYNDVNYNHEGLGTSWFQPHSLWTFQQFIDQIYAPLISSLIYSDTFNEIYADLRNSKFTSQYSFEFWHADMISDDYQAEIKDAEDVLVIYHNTMRVGAPLNPSDAIDPNTSQICVTAWNDVVEDPTNDTLVHNPVFLHNTDQYRAFVAAADSSSANTVVKADHIIMDFKDPNPSLDYRVDAMMNKYFHDFVDVKTTTAIPGMTKYYGKINFILPVFYAVQDYTFCDGWEKQSVRVDGSPILARGNDYNNGWYPLDAHYVVRAYANSAASSTQHQHGYDLATSAFVQANGDMGNIAVDVPWNICMRYVNGCPILPWYGRSVTRGTGDIIQYQTRFDGNVDNWYKLPTFKLYNMFNHAYQHLFTADGVLK